jgi:hypothetical protein
MWQFSTRTLFLIMALAAGVAWVMFSPPQWAGLIVLYLIHLLLPAAVLAGIVYHRGAWQAFFIGCAPWIALLTFFLWIWFVDDFPRFRRGDWFDVFDDDAIEVMQYKMYLATPLFLATISGLIAVGVWAWAARTRRQQPGS